MTGKIIGKRVVPDVFEVYEKDVGTNSIKFSVNKLNDGINFEEIDGYAHIDFESGKTDRALLNKTVDGEYIIYELPITKAITGEEGRHRIQLSFEKDDLTIIYKTCIFYYVVCESIDGNLAFENLVPSVVNELEERMEQALVACNDLRDETSAYKSEVFEALVGLEEFKSDATLALNNTVVLDSSIGFLQGKINELESADDKIEVEVENLKGEVLSLSTDLAQVKSQAENLEANNEAFKAQVLQEKDGVIEAKNEAVESAKLATKAVEDLQIVKEEVVGEIQGAATGAIGAVQGAATDATGAVQGAATDAIGAIQVSKEDAVSSVQGAIGGVEAVASQVSSYKAAVEAIKDDCLSIKSEVFNVRDNTAILRDDAYSYAVQSQDACQSAINFYDNVVQGSYVTSINNKRGDVVLHASDIEGLESVSLEPLIINGVTYDGSSQVNINVNDSKNYQVISAQDYELHLENQSCVFIKNVEKLSLYSDKLEGLDGCFCEIYFTINSEPLISVSSKFYFYGDSCYMGMFKPVMGNYYLRFYSIEKNSKIHVEVKKLENKTWNYSLVQGFPAVVNYESGVDYVNNVTINGALKTEVVNGVNTVAYPVSGVGEPFIDENGNQKYKIDIVTRNANLLDVPFFSDGVDSYSVAYDEYENKFRFYGMTYMEYETIFPLNAVIEKNTTICLNAFSFLNYTSTSLTNGRLLEFTLSSDTADILKLGIDYMGNPCAVEGYSSSGYITEDIKYLKIKVLERAIETQFDTLIGVTVSKNEPMLEYEPSIVSVSSVVIDEPLLLYGGNCDKFYLKEGYISKGVAARVIHDKSQLEPLNDSDDATAIIRYNENFPAIASHFRKVWIHGRTEAESLECLNINNAKYLEFKRDYFGTYRAFDEGAFPIVIVYPTAYKQIRLPLCPIIKVFEGETTFNIEGGEKPSGGSVPNIKK
ncbi:MAG: apolipoprotein A1/A4/E family protein [Clostridia bacterium]|nr:apolipoprotein A1/A4/E family protein [Clostridia bacterium]